VTLFCLHRIMRWQLLDDVAFGNSLLNH
jgi:hypothetical protein